MWMVAILSGRLCHVINRDRWVKNDDGVGWVGIFSNIYLMLPTAYRL